VGRLVAGNRDHGFDYDGAFENVTLENNETDIAAQDFPLPSVLGGLETSLGTD
jgi:hypothetical protein